MTDLIIIKSDNELAKNFMLDVSRVKTVDPHKFTIKTNREKDEQIAKVGDTGIKIKHADGTITYHPHFIVDDIAGAIIVNQAIQNSLGSNVESLLAKILAVIENNKIAPDTLPAVPPVINSEFSILPLGEGWVLDEERVGVPNPLAFEDIDSISLAGQVNKHRNIWITVNGKEPVLMKGFTEHGALALLAYYRDWFHAQPCNQPKDQKANQTIRDIANRHLEIIDNRKNPTRHIELTYGKIDTYRQVFDIIRKEGKPDRIHTEIDNTEIDRVVAHIYYSWKGEE